MSAIPCKQDEELQKKIEEYVELLKTRAHTIGHNVHGMSETEFYESGLFRGAIERIRGQFSATMSVKREFVRHVLNHMEDRGLIKEHEDVGHDNRFDYVVNLLSGRKCVIELKGGGDGNNTNIMERPHSADEFIIWFVSTNTSGDPRENAWSALNSRLSVEMIKRPVQIDGAVFWDYACGTDRRICPKVEGENPIRRTTVGPYNLVPPCIYLLPKSIPDVRNDPEPEPNKIENVEFLNALQKCFGGKESELNQVRVRTEHRGSNTVRKTTIIRDGKVCKSSKFRVIKRNT